MTKLQLTRSNFLRTPKEKEALKFARDKHRGQIGPHSSKPYINHCIEVSRILYKNGYSEDVIVSGILHDTVTNTETTLLDIEEMFGEDVSNIVKHVSEDSDSSLSWTEKKMKYIQSVLNSPKESVLVSLADNLHTSSEILQDWLRIGDTVFESLEENKEKQKWFYRSLYEVYLIRGSFFDDESFNNLYGNFDTVLKSMKM
jgi:(p)ppGpp synthase/HD superfamily hydrolase